MEDLGEGILQDVKVTNEYVFTNDGFYSPNRFKLHFEFKDELDEGKNSAIKIYSQGNTIFLKKPFDKKGILIIYDVFGRTILTKKIRKGRLIKTNLDVSSGIYLTKFRSNDFLIIEKIPLSN